ncbi:hypothetical protein [Mesorhizobium sp. M0643]|uniref:glycosyltransferase family 9 protein n=1 Tax=Mesorhizobium sp. M0643 TaxID=2956978 RepID=UPI003336718B
MRGTPVQRGRELYAMLRALRRFRFDLTIDLADSKTSRIIVRLVNAKTRVGYDPPEKPLRWLERQPANVLAKPFGFGGQHYLYRYLSPLRRLAWSCVRRSQRLSRCRWRPPGHWRFSTGIISGVTPS